jgi:hypothetical protein
MSKSRVRRKPANDEPFDPLAVPVEGANRMALWAYRLGLWGLIPVVGLLLGPAALIWGILARLRGRRDPTFTFHPPAWAGIALGALVSVTNWLGVWLMVLGLRAAG